MGTTMTDLRGHIGAWLLVALLSGGVMMLGPTQRAVLTLEGALSSPAPATTTESLGFLHTAARTPRNLGWQPSADSIMLAEQRLDPPEDEPVWTRWRAAGQGSTRLSQAGGLQLSSCIATTPPKSTACGAALC